VTTTNTYTIKASGGDYTSLSAAVVAVKAIQADLVSADLIVVFECYDLGAADSTAVLIDGWTTGASNYIRIVVPSAERHAGTRNTSKYRLVGAPSFQGMLHITVPYVRIHGLQVSATNANPCINLKNISGGTILITDTLAYDGGSIGINMESCTCALTMLNTAMMNNAGDGFYGPESGTANVYNCNSVNNGGTGFSMGGFGTRNFKNCYAGGNTGADYGGAFTDTTCFSEDGSQSTATAAFATGSGGYFSNVTAGTEDLHIGASSTLKDAGTDLSGWSHPDGDVDIDGGARQVGAWDVGFDEQGGAPAPPADPTGLLMTATGTDSIDVSWTDNATDETGFEFQYDTASDFSNDPQTIIIASANTTSTSVTGLLPGTQYWGRVRAYNGVGYSNWSSTATGTTTASPSTISGGARTRSRSRTR